MPSYHQNLNFSNEFSFEILPKFFSNMQHSFPKFSSAFGFVCQFNENHFGTSWYQFPLWNFRCGVCLMKLKAIWFSLCFPFNRMLSFPLRKSLKWTEELKDFKKPLFKAFWPLFQLSAEKTLEIMVLSSASCKCDDFSSQFSNAF